MSQLYTYIAMLAIISVVGILFRKTTTPIGLLLVITGIILSLFEKFPRVELDPQLVLNVFLPVIIYQASAYTALRDIKKYRRSIALLSIGHVIFITVLVASLVHFLLPDYGWPLAFLLGAIISPPDDVVILSIAEKVNLPRRLITILEAEGMLNDATALILFRFSLAALMTHQFSMSIAISEFFLIVIGETLYGIMLGYIIGKIRMKFTDITLQMIVSLVTPFLAYLPPQYLGGSGVLATVVTGLVIGNYYLERFTPEVRLTGRAVWTTIAFILQNVLFLLVGLNFRFIMERLSFIPYGKLLFFAFLIIACIIVGRFIWVFSSVYLARLIPSIRKKEPAAPPWQFSFIISWAGMRGSVSLAAALAVPALFILELNVRDFLVFIVFCCIVVTLLVQGLTLPWVIKLLGVRHHQQKEKYSEHMSELTARVSMLKAGLNWLKIYKNTIQDNPELSLQISLHIKQYQFFKKQLIEKIKNHPESIDHDGHLELQTVALLASELLEVERAELNRLWRKEKISYLVKNKLVQQLDFRARHLT